MLFVVITLYTGILASGAFRVVLQIWFVSNIISKAPVPPGITLPSAILDETDSGLDVDALRIVSEGVNRVKAESNIGVLLITHYTRILRYIKPDFVHVFANGHIVEEGGAELADKLEENGYAEYIKS